MKKPKSALNKAGGMLYFPRMLDKIRLFAAGELHPDYHPNLGRRFDGWCTEFLHIAYGDVKARALQGGTDEEILAWCCENGRALNDTDLLVWNAFVEKLGWNDAVTPTLEKYKAESGLAHRADIVTMPQYYDADEGRA